MNLLFLKNNIFRINKPKQLLMYRNIIPILLLISVLGCKQSKENDEKTEVEPNTEVIETTTNSTTLNFNYKYPKNLIPQRNEENSPELYAIGFSPEGNFAYIDRPCSGGCGCCTHDVIIQDLLTDKIESVIDIKTPSEDGEIHDHVKNWSDHFSKIEKNLKLKGISQTSLQINKSKSFTDEITKHRYDIKIFKKEQQNQNDNEDVGLWDGNKIIYNVYVTINDGKSKRITKGVIQNGIDLEYIGFIRSPYTDMIAVILNKKSTGFELETFNEVVVVGCQLDPSFY
jgi:hypothetical protein